MGSQIYSPVCERSATSSRSPNQEYQSSGHASPTTTAPSSHFIAHTHETSQVQQSPRDHRHYTSDEHFATVPHGIQASVSAPTESGRHQSSPYGQQHIHEHTHVSTVAAGIRVYACGHTPTTPYEQRRRCAVCDKENCPPGGMHPNHQRNGKLPDREHDQRSPLGVSRSSWQASNSSNALNHSNSRNVSSASNIQPNTVIHTPRASSFKENHASSPENWQLHHNTAGYMRDAHTLPAQFTVYQDAHHTSPKAAEYALRTSQMIGTAGPVCKEPQTSLSHANAHMEQNMNSPMVVEYSDNEATSAVTPRDSLYSGRNNLKPPAAPVSRYVNNICVHARTPGVFVGGTAK
jgi:hypothetical protein